MLSRAIEGPPQSPSSEPAAAAKEPGREVLDGVADFTSKKFGESVRDLAGAPLPVTDLVINPKDGALYFVTGGRNIMSGLYRVTYTGNEPVTDWKPSVAETDAAVRLRHRLEQGHTDPGSLGLDPIWARLSSADRAVRFAARIALEHRPVATWSERALRETDPRAAIAALLALTRNGDHTLGPHLARALARIKWDLLTPADRLDLLRTYSVVLSRHGQGAAGRSMRDIALTALQNRFPDDDERLNRELAEILIFVRAPNIISRVLRQLEETPTQERQIHYVMCLRDAHDGWTLAERRRLFRWFQRSVAQRGGFLFGDYLDQIRAAIESQLTKQQHEQLADVLELPVPVAPLEQLQARPLVKKWTVDDVLQIAAVRPTSGERDRGRRIFTAALCYRCHRFQGQGGMVGPDLTNVTRRLNLHDLVQSIVDPNRVISDQYRAVQILSDDGRIVSGKITDINGNTLVIMNDPFDQSNLSMVQRDAIEEMQWSSVSPMPANLLDTFTEAEITALFAFLQQSP